MADDLLYYGDNLDILRRYVEDESVDLVYLDPPFNSNADYKVLFPQRAGSFCASLVVCHSSVAGSERGRVTSVTEFPMIAYPAKHR